jgi:tape measure domain-containing protein
VIGFKFDNMRQQADIAFTTMLGSGQKAKAFLDDMQRFAAKTPFDFEGLLKASQRMLAMGFSAKEVKPSLTAIGDAMAGLGQGSEVLQNVTTALGQMKMAGRVTAQDMNQLTNAGVAGWKYLAEATGKSVAEVRKMSEQGLLDGAQAVKVITAGMERDFGGMMEKQAHTFGGLVSTFKDTAQQLSGTVMKPIFEAATKGMDAFASKLPDITRAVDGFMKKMGEASGAGEKFGVVFDALKGFAETAFGAIRSGFEKINWGALWDIVAKALGKIPEIALDLIGIAQKIHEKLTHAFNSVPWGKVWDTVTDALAKVPDIAAKIVGGFVKNAVDTFEALKRAFDAIPWAKIWDVVMTALAAIPPLATNVLEGIGKIASGLYDSLLGAIRRTPWAKIGEELGDTVAQLAANISIALNKVDWDKVGQAIVAGLGTAIKAVGTFFIHIDWIRVLGGLGALEVAIGKMLLGLVTGIVRGLNELGNQINREARGALGHVASDIGQWFIGKLEDAMAKLEEVGLKIVAKLIHPFTLLPDSLGGKWAKEIQDKVNAQLKAISTKEAGSDAADQGKKRGGEFGKGFKSAAEAAMRGLNTDPEAAATGSYEMTKNAVTKGVGQVSAQMINDAARKAGVPPALLAALIQQESGGDQSLRNDSGATGVGQLVPDRAGLDYKTIGGVRYNINSLQSNLAGTAAYLAGGLTSYGGDQTKALENYYGGSGGVRNPNESGGVIRNAAGKVIGSYPTPKDYATQVLKKAAKIPTVNTMAQPGAVKWSGGTSGLKSSFMKKVEAAIASLGGGTISVSSGKRSGKDSRGVDHPGGPPNGGAPDSNHLTGSAVDGTVTLKNGKTFNLGDIPGLNYASFGLRAGRNFPWNGSPDVVHVDDGSNVNGGTPLPVTAPGVGSGAGTGTGTGGGGDLPTLDVGGGGAAPPKPPPITEMSPALAKMAKAASKTPDQDDDVAAMKAYRALLEKRADEAGLTEKSKIALDKKIASLTKSIDTKVVSDAELAQTGIAKKLKSIIASGDIGDVDNVGLRKNLQKLASGIRQDIEGLVTTADVKDAKFKLGQLKEGIKGALQFDTAAEAFKPLHASFETLVKEGFFTPAQEKAVQASFDRLKKTMSAAKADNFVDKDEAKKIKDILKALSKTIGDSTTEYAKAMADQAEIVAKSKKGLQDAISGIGDTANEIGGRLKREFESAAKAVGINVGIPITPETVRIAATMAQKLRDSLSNFMPESQRKIVAAQLDALGETIKTGLANAEANVTSSLANFRGLWGKLKDAIMEGFREKVVLKFQATIDFAEGEMNRRIAEAEGKKLATAYTTAIAGTLNEGEEKIHASVERLRAAQSAYADAVISQDRGRISAAIDELLAAQAQMAGIETAGLSEREALILSSGQALAAAEKTASDQRIQAEKAGWEAGKEAALIEVGDMIDKIQGQLERGEITMGQAMSQIATVLRDHGMDASDALQLVSDSAGGSMSALVTAVTNAFSELKSSLDTLIAMMRAAAGESKTIAEDTASSWEAAAAKIKSAQASVVSIPSGVAPVTQQTIGTQTTYVPGTIIEIMTPNGQRHRFRYEADGSATDLGPTSTGGAGGFAEGGQVNYVGAARYGMRVPGVRGPQDTLYAKVSPGELIMTVAQQTKLADAIVGRQGGPVPTIIIQPGLYTGEDVAREIRNVLQRMGMRSGQSIFGGTA